MTPDLIEGQRTVDSHGSSFALDLLAALPRAPKVVLSPASARTALGMALVGARGQTAADLGAGLRIGSADPADFHAGEAARIARWNDPSRPYAVVSANAVFVAEGMRTVSGAAATLQEAYRAPLRALAFAGDPAGATGEINRWVKEITRGLVPEIATPGAIGPETRFVLTNALYFKGEWRTKFLRDATHQAPFEVRPGEKPMVSCMHQTAQHRVSVGPEAEVLEMAYQGDDLAMTFVVPPRGTALADFESRLAPETLAGWLASLVEERVRVTLPRFSADTGVVQLRAPLESMGVRAPFDASVSDFGGLFDEPAVLDQVLHRARIAVDEDGTEAAAATAAFGFQFADRSSPRVFTIDRPFLFFLRDLRDGSLLFAGRVEDPR